VSIIRSLMRGAPLTSAILCLAWLAAACSRPEDRAAPPMMHDHTPHHGGVVGMAGMIHLEARAERGGLVQVFLSDRWRKPLPLDGVRGTAAVRLSTGNVELPLTAGREALEAHAPRLEGRAVDVGVQLVRAGEPIEMHFELPLEADAAGAAGVPADGCVSPSDAATSGRRPRCTMAFERGVSAVAASADGSTAIVAIADLGVSAWTVSSGKLLRGLAAPPPVQVPSGEAPHVESANAVAVRPGSREAAVALENRVLLYSLGTGEVLASFGQLGVVRDLVWSSDGQRLLVSVFYDRDARLLDAANGRAVAAFTVEREAAAVALDASGDVAAVSSETGSLGLFDVGRQRLIRLWRPAPALTRAVAFAGGTLVTAGDDGVLRAWNAAGGALEYESPAAHPIHRLGIAPGDRLVATAGVGGEIRLHDLQRHELVETLNAGDAQVTGVAWAGDVLISGDVSGRVAMWDLADRVSPGR
jgi:hypothetical protein